MLSAWRWSYFDPGREAGVSSHNQESLPIWGKHECLEVGNYGVGDSGMGEIRDEWTNPPKVPLNAAPHAQHTKETRQRVLGHPSIQRRLASLERPFLSFQLEPKEALKLRTSNRCSCSKQI